ncbi:hypothetical protein GPLA_2156 [Paraglaciecola polaris LMG 21857]|uniref:Uncharacterized protein n=1 Tax=Paraglaciecola polaris LMG 21857 TaxID=1129793 RepID=K6ZA97_9ALTE|nr:hypothetical protein GPLA_2156 [Paraglaciecola polaris LMG 21857]
MLLSRGPALKNAYFELIMASQAAVWAIHEFLPNADIDI